MTRKYLILGLCGILWLCVVGTGARIVMDYENTSGVAAASAQWPVSSRIQRPPGRATLIMLAHPQCPCTRASIGELSLLMSRCQGQLSAYVLFLKPAGTAPEWEKTALWRSAAAIPGVTVVRDEEGHEARRFHSTTSGQTMLFDRTGRLLFSGGITAARGHSGDNAGRDAIISMVTTGRASRTKTPVFGCSLLNPEAQAAAQPTGGTQREVTERPTR